MKPHKEVASKYESICKEIKCKPVPIRVKKKPKVNPKRNNGPTGKDWKPGDYIDGRDEFSPTRQPYGMAKGTVKRAKKKRSEVAYQIMYNRDRFPGLILRYLTPKGFYKTIRFPLKTRPLKVILGNVLSKTKQLMDDKAMVVQYAWWDDEDMDHLCDVLMVRPITLFTDTIPTKEKV